MLFGPSGAPLIPGKLGTSEDIDRGLGHLREQVAANVTTFYLARAVDGFALLVASPKRFNVGRGLVIGVSLTVVNLAAMRNRCFELLGQSESEPSRLTADATAFDDSAPAVDGITDGFGFVGEQLAQGRASFSLGAGGPTGYVLLVGSTKCFDVAQGVGIGLPLSEMGLRGLRARVVELLHGSVIARRVEQA